MVKNLFARLNKGRPAPNEDKQHNGQKIFSPMQKLPPAQLLLSWLLYDWPQSTVTLRDICNLGPNSIRRKETALSLAEVLSKLGWLTPLEARRRDIKKWKIVKDPPTERPPKLPTQQRAAQTTASQNI
jgi:hypothetical protein